MFYPELSPAMRWQLEQHQKMYSMYHSMEAGKMGLRDQYGESQACGRQNSDAQEDSGQAFGPSKSVLILRLLYKPPPK